MRMDLQHIDTRTTVTAKSIITVYRVQVHIHVYVNNFRLRIRATMLWNVLIYNNT